MATGADGLRYHACLISNVRYHPSHEMMERRDEMPGDVLSHFLARPPLARSRRSAYFKQSPAPGRREEPATVDLRLRA